MHSSGYLLRMAVHIIFFVVYLFLGNVFNVGPTAMNTALIVHCIVALLLSANKTVRYITPINIIYFACIIASFANITVEGKVGTAENRMNAYMITKYLPEAAQIWVLGSCCMFIGYAAITKKSLPSIRLDITKAQSYKFFPYIVFIALFSVEIVRVTSFLGSLNKLIYLTGSIGILFYSRLWASENDNKYRNYAFLLYFIQTYNSLTHSFLRNELILPTVIFMAGYFSGKNSIKYLMSYRILPFVAVFALFISIFGALGKNRDQADNFAQIISQEVQSSGQDQSIGDVYSEDEQQSGTFLDRNANVAQLTNVVNLTVEHGFYNGEISSPLIVALVPRFLWPEKPDIIIGMWFAGTIGQGQFTKAGHATNSINLTVPGQCYIDFSWPGVIIGCILFGMALSLLWNSFEFFASGYNAIGILYGGYLLSNSFNIAPDLQIVITYLSTYLLFFMIKKIIVLYF